MMVMVGGVDMSVCRAAIAEVAALSVVMYRMTISA